MLCGSMASSNRVQHILRIDCAQNLQKLARVSRSQSAARLGEGEGHGEIPHWHARSHDHGFVLFP
ncbi:hypothetical protein OESDEN_17607 [Oesophagostomum dentatum]|uniref:Uncharacterized protein n=1 Tax=Oesophagostomum dentatum TaxID=61180 RepID=A0A0B1SBN8_OESDE|nr:hypothetical protein OESDEN_17607 [Oesophagostomum dentatum]